MSRPRAPSGRHGRLVSELESEGCRTKGFMASVRRSVGGRCEANDRDMAGAVWLGKDCDHCFLDHCLEGVSPRPDAYRVQRGRMLVTAYEVEVTHPLSEAHLDDYNFLRTALDEFYWSFRIVLVDRFGNRNEVDLAKRASDLSWEGATQDDIDYWKGRLAS